MAKKKIILNTKQEFDIINFYLIPNSLNETARHFKYLGFSIPHGKRIVKTLLKKYNIQTHSADTIRKITNINISNSYQTKSATEKIAIKNKRKNTTLRRYQVEHTSQVPSIIEKMKETTFKHFHCTCSLQNPEILKKTEQTFLNKYNCKPHVFNNRQKAQETCNSKYGVPFATRDNTVKNKISNSKKNKTTIEKQNIQDKRNKTLILKYGSADIFKFGSQAFKMSIFNKYGVYNYSQTLEASKTRRTLYKYKDECFDSFPELCFYLYHILNKSIIIRTPIEFIYTYNNQQHKYYPDFCVNNQLYELKGNQFLKEDGTWQNPFDHSLDQLFEAKHQCAIKNNVKILYNKDYKKYVEWFTNMGFKKELYKI